MDLDLGLDGLSALVTGGTQGIGRAVVELLLEQGADVLTIARDGARLERCLAQWNEGVEGDGRTRRGFAHGLAGDVTEPADRARLLARAKELFTGLDLAVLNVGTNRRKQVRDYTDAEVAAILRTNQEAAFLLARDLEELLLEAHGGGEGPSAALAFVLSVAGHVHVGTGAPYAMTKAALDQLTRSLACEWAPSIRVNAVSPWYTRTPLAEQVLSDPAYEERVVDATPLRYVADPREVAVPIAFLCSPWASYVTGQTLAVDGGFLARGAF